MIKTRKEARNVSVVESIVCDACGREARPEGDNQFEFQEFLRVRDTGGYGSVFGDGTTWELDLCQRCLKRTLGKHIRIVETPEEPPPEDAA